jgi:hypothetical protein
MEIVLENVRFRGQSSHKLGLGRQSAFDPCRTWACIRPLEWSDFGAEAFEGGLLADQLKSKFHKTAQ